MMGNFNTDNKRQSKPDSGQPPFHPVIGWAKRNLLNLPDGGITARRKTGRMLLPVVAILLVFVLVRAFKVSSPESAVSEPLGLLEQTTTEPNSTDANELGEWQIPEMYPNTLTDCK